MEEGGKPLELAVCHGGSRAVEGKGESGGVEGGSVRVWTWSGCCGGGRGACTERPGGGVAECIYHIARKKGAKGEESALCACGLLPRQEEQEQRPAAARGL